ncbi:restriction endonuclease subunit S [Cronobacter sakazakii]|uniref:restriction endonuclease subunit S n=1 Tax=Cronobacter sakazakii TaxID=28141 RepID=UPI000CFE04AB|nr:restriction endonuclease subunit S [Cronobacter sakazakii]
MRVEKLLTDHIDIWSSSLQTRSTAGRGSSGKIDLYGIKKLRELILELAVRGKLVPQDPNDQPASELLKRIAAEKAELVKQGKIKKQKPLPEIREEEKPFELPEGWEWVRLSEAFYLEMGQSPLSEHYNQLQDGIPFFQGKADFGDIYPTARYWCNLPSKLSEKDDVLLSVRAPVGPTNLSPYQCCIGRGLAAIRCLCDFSHHYLLFAFRALQPRLKSLATGTTFSAISKSDIEPFLIPVPSVNEQLRIVSKINELMSLCDQLEQQSLTSLEAHQQLVETILATLTDSQNAEELAENWVRISQHFDTLFTTVASIDALKQTILQLAVMGKLVPQDPSDETAEILLSRLRLSRQSKLNSIKSSNKEAETMLRKLSRLPKAELPFKIPDNWSVAHLIDICELLVDCHNKTAPYQKDGIPIIRTTNIRNRKFIATDLKFVDEKTYDFWSRRCPPEPGDIIFTREAPMGEALIIPDKAKWCLGQRTMLIRLMHDFINNEYILLSLTEPHLLARAAETAVGLTVKHLRVGDVEKMNIPIPPLNEQRLIVEKVKDIFLRCDTLKSRLQSAQQTQLHLADALTDAALN